MTASSIHGQTSSRDTANIYRNVSRDGNIAFKPSSAMIRRFGLVVFTSVATATPSPSNPGTLKSRDSSDDHSSSSSLSGGAIAGIVIGVIVFFAILEFLWERERIMTWIRRRKSSNPPPYEDPESNDSSVAEESKTHSTATLERQTANGA